MKPKFAIIGCGRISRRHAEQMIKVGELVAVCDIIYSQAEELGKEYNAAIYTEQIILKPYPVTSLRKCYGLKLTAWDFYSML